MSEKWFAYTPEYGMEVLATEAEAKARAESLLEENRQYAVDEGEWPDQTDQICWGRLHGEARLSREDQYGAEYSLFPLE